MAISTLLIIAVYKTFVIREPCMWPSSQRVLRTSVIRASDRCKENQGSNPVGESRCWIVKSLLTKWSKQGLHSPLKYSRIYSVWYLFVHLGKRACLWTDSSNLSKWFVTYRQQSKILVNDKLVSSKSSKFLYTVTPQILPSDSWNPWFPSNTRFSLSSTDSLWCLFKRVKWKKEKENVSFS